MKKITIMLILLVNFCACNEQGNDEQNINNITIDQIITTQSSDFSNIEFPNIYSDNVFDDIEIPFRILDSTEKERELLIKYCNEIIDYSDDEYKANKDFIGIDFIITHSDTSFRITDITPIIKGGTGCTANLH